MLSSFFHWLADTILRLGYPGIVVLMAIESSVLPLPSELVMPPAGYLAAKGQMNAVWAVVAGTLGSVIGALINYALALYVGEPLPRKYGKYVLVSARSLDRTEAFFRRHGEISTLIGRLLPVVRHLISIPAGVSRMNLGRFIFFTALGAGLWCAILTYLGWLIGRHGEQVDAAIGTYVHHTLLSYVLPAVALLLGGYVVAPASQRQDRRVTDRRYVVTGLVQGVGFRWFVARHARSLGFAGYARNLADGRVEVVVRGPEEALPALEQLLGAGPANAQVEGVERFEEAAALPVGKSFDVM